MTPAAEEAELHPWDTGTLDIAKCDRTEFVVALYDEFEKAGVRFETWPAPVQALMTRHLEAWLAAHPERASVAVTYAAPKRGGKQVCVLILHHHRKAAAESAAAPPATSLL